MNRVLSTGLAELNRSGRGRIVVTCIPGFRFLVKRKARERYVDDGVGHV